MTAQKLPPAGDILELAGLGESHEAIGARYGVRGEAVDKAILRARQRGEIPPAPPRPQPVEKPARKPVSAVSALDNTPRSANPRGPVGDRKLRAPATGAVCGARQIVGTRVCDQAPHPPGTACVGEGASDPRGEFWGRRT